MEEFVLSHRLQEKKIFLSIYRIHVAYYRMLYSIKPSNLKNQIPKYKWSRDLYNPPPQSQIIRYTYNLF